MSPPSSCAVLVPVSGALDPKTETCLRALADRGHPVDLLRGGSQIDLARSGMVSIALARGCQETLWIDSDMTFEPDDVERIRALDLPITAGLYMKKDRSGLACKFLDGTRKVVMGANGGVVEVRYAGTGFLHVRRGVYEGIEAFYKLPKCGGYYDPAVKIVPYFIPAVAPDGAGGFDYLSEDYVFCHRAREAGFKIMADTRVRIGHLGQCEYSWDDFLNNKTYQSVEVTVTTPVR